MKWILNHPKAFALLVVVSIAALSFLFVYLFTRPAIISALNLSAQGNLGSAIGGLTAPIIGICTSVLLFFALIFQFGANQNQSQKTELDILATLQQDFLHEIQSFAYSFELTKGTSTWFRETVGLKALTKFVYDLKNVYPHELKLSDHPEASQISQLIDSYLLLEGHMVSAQIESRYKTLLLAKLRSYYTNYLERNFQILNDDCDAHPNVQDHITEKLGEFLKIKDEINPAINKLMWQSINGLGNRGGAKNLI